MPTQLINSYFTSLFAKSGNSAYDGPAILPQQLNGYLELYKWSCLSRAIDVFELNITQQGEAFFHVSSAGHESMACLNSSLQKKDYLYCHYRDRALLLARGMPLQTFFNALYATDSSPSLGRQMNAHLHDSSLGILSIVGPVGNHALHCVGLAMESQNHPDKPIVLCSMGDGTSQQGEVLEAIAEAVRSELRILFVVEDNGLSISTRTAGKTFYSRPDGLANDYYGIHLNYLDGKDIVSCGLQFSEIVQSIRNQNKPAITILRVPRLFDHTNSDNQQEYRTQEELYQLKQNDPLLIFHHCLLSHGVNASELEKLHEEIAIDVDSANQLARSEVTPHPQHSAYSGKDHLNLNRKEVTRINSIDTPLTMNEAIREVLSHNMLADESISLYGEDIEDPKGDVFGLTKGLSSRFPQSVKNSPLAEASIIGISIGRALAGGRPVAFIQFADFLPLALNQISSELATMDWRTNGEQSCPVIIMVACGGYRPGLGPFHSQTLESIACHIPGINVMMPSNASDAAGLLNGAFQSRKPAIFFYPISCLNNKDLWTSNENIPQQYVPPGKAHIIRYGDALTFVSWGNGISLCLWAAKKLEETGIDCEIIDLRSLAPWDKQAVLRSVNKTGHLIVVHEDTITCGMGAEVIASTIEASEQSIRVARVARPETFVPFNFSNQLDILPSRRSVLDAAGKILNLNISWENTEPTTNRKSMTINAVSHSPSDDTVIIAEWLVQPGDDIRQGQTIAYIEGDKTISEMVSPKNGKLIGIIVAEGGRVPVGSPLLKIQNPDDSDRMIPVTREVPCNPVITTFNKSTICNKQPLLNIFLTGISATVGSRLIDNQELSERWPDTSASDIYKLTGIQQRHYIDRENESVETLAISVVKKLLQKMNLTINDIDLIICSTTTPLQTTPSLACSVLAHFPDSNGDCAAYDINAACSGYIYSLQSAYDFLQGQGGGNAILVTSEALSPLLNNEDFDTAIIFGDAATATLLTSTLPDKNKSFLLRRPITAAIGDYKENIFVPSSKFDSEKISMNGKKVFTAGVKNMIKSLDIACTKYAYDSGQLNYIVPHQANQRIMSAITNRLQLPEDTVLSNIRNHGNTSSSSIPLCMAEKWNQFTTSDLIGFTAFGGGYTYGATIIKCKDDACKQAS